MVRRKKRKTQRNKEKYSLLCQSHFAELKSSKIIIIIIIISATAEAFSETPVISADCHTNDDLENV